MVVENGMFTQDFFNVHLNLQLQVAYHMCTLGSRIWHDKIVVMDSVVSMLRLHVRHHDCESNFTL